MSIKEIERFNADVKANSNMQEELRSIGDDVEKVVRFANANGYQFDASDVSALSGDADLTEDDLDKIAGGGGAVGVAALMVVEVIGVVAVGSA